MLFSTYKEGSEDRRITMEEFIFYMDKIYNLIRFNEKKLITFQGTSKLSIEVVYLGLEFRHNRIYMRYENESTSPDHCEGAIIIYTDIKYYSYLDNTNFSPTQYKYNPMNEITLQEIHELIEDIESIISMNTEELPVGGNLEEDEFKHYMRQIYQLLATNYKPNRESYITSSDGTVVIKPREVISEIKHNNLTFYFSLNDYRNISIGFVSVVKYSAVLCSYSRYGSNQDEVFFTKKQGLNKEDLEGFIEHLKQLDN